MTLIERHFKKAATNQVLLILSVFAGFSYALMALLAYSPASQFDVNHFLDLKFFYTQETFLNQIASINVIQARIYQMIHFVDYLFILTFYPLLALVMARFLQPQRLQLTWIAIAAMTSDLIENLIIDYHLHFPPLAFLATLSGFFTALKFSLLILAILALLIFKKRGNTDVQTSI